MGTRSGKNNPCPVCGRGNPGNPKQGADCAIDLTSEGLTKVRCHTHIDDDPSIAGWVYRGATDCGTWGLFFEKVEKPVRERKTTEYIYHEAPGKPILKVVRIDKGDGEKICPQYSYTNGEWRKGVGMGVPNRTHLYRIFDPINQQAKEEGKPIFITEGEGKADLLLSMGIAATSAPGGAGKWNHYGHANYIEDLQYFYEIVLCPDRDVAGVKHMLDVAKDFPTAKWLYAYPDSPIWDNVPEKKGLDVADWVTDYKLSAEQVLAVIEPAAREFGKAGKEDVKTKPEGKKEAKQDKSDWLEGENGQLLDPADEVKTAFDAHVFTRLFQSGNGEWCTIDSSFYRYDGKGAWKAQNDDDVQQMISTYSMGCYKLKKIGDEWIANQCFGKNANTRSAFEFSRTMLNRKAKASANTHLRAFRNCTINLITGEILEHSKEHYLTTKVDADYFPDAECPEIFLRFVRSSFGIEMLELIRALTYMFIDPTAPYGKFVHIIGPSGSGKGTMIRFWQEIFGLKHSRSSASLSELEKPEGRHQGLTGVGFYAVPDIGGYLSGLKPFYELVDNGAMSGRALFAPSGYQKKWNCRFAIASVDHLQIENSGDGWDRRCILLPSKQRVGPIDRTLEDELIAAKSQIISWVLGMDKTRRDYVINNADEIEQIEAMKSDARTNGDSVQLFVDLCLRPDPFSTEKVENAELHTYYEAFCQVHGLQKMGYPRFISHLKTVLPNNHRARKRQSSEWVSAHWGNLKPLDGLFINVDFQKGYAECVKSKCKEGGMHAFKRYVAESVDGSPGWTQEVMEPLPKLSRFESLVFFNLLSTVENPMCSREHNLTASKASLQGMTEANGVNTGGVTGYPVSPQSQSGKGFQESNGGLTRLDSLDFPVRKNSETTSENLEKDSEKISKVDLTPGQAVTSQNESSEPASDKAASLTTDPSGECLSDASQTLSDQGKCFQAGDKVKVLNWSGQILSGVGRVVEVGDGGCFVADHPTVYGWVNFSDLRPHQSL